MPSPPSYGMHGGPSMNHFAPGPPPTHKKCGGLSPCCIVSIVLGCLFVAGLIVVLFVVALAAQGEDRTSVGQYQKMVDDHMPVPQCPALGSWPVVSSGTRTYLHPVYDKFANDLDAVFAVSTAVDTKISVQTGLAIAPRSPAYVLSDELVQATDFVKTTVKKFPSDKRLAFAGLHAWATTAFAYQKAADALQDNAVALQSTPIGGPVIGEAERALALELNDKSSGGMGGMVVPADGERWVPVVWDASLRNSANKATNATAKTLMVPFGVLHADSTSSGAVADSPRPLPPTFVIQECKTVPVSLPCLNSPLALRRLLVDAAAKRGVDMELDGSSSKGKKTGVFPVGFNLWTLLEDKGNNFPLVFPDFPGKVYRARVELENLRSSSKSTHKFSLMHVLRWKKAIALRFNLHPDIPADKVKANQFVDAILSLGTAAALQKWVDSNNNEERYQLFGDVDSFQPGSSYVFKNFDMRPGGFPTFHGAATRVGASPGFMAGVVPPGALRRSTESRFVLIRESVLKDIIAEKKLATSDLEAMGFKQELVMR